MMRALLTIALVSLFVTSAFSEEKQVTRLTTNILEQANLRMEEAANKQDADTLLAYLSSNAVITVSFPANPEFPKMAFSKQTYASHLAQSWAIFRDVSIQRLKTEYDISTDGKSATTISTFRQTATVKSSGQTFTSSGKQVAAIRLNDGIPQTTRVDVTISYK